MIPGRRPLPQLHGRVVQATDGVRRGPRNGTWARTQIRSATPVQVRIVYWVLKGRIEGKEKGICLKWVLACLAMVVLVSSSSPPHPITLVALRTDVAALYSR
ncbi:hypothetical protein BDW71DRAFT_181507 [Aspergillus fruticulosus]